MAHSRVENAGQRYARARKDQVRGELLTELRANMVAHDTKPNEQSPPLGEVNAKIARENRAVQASRGWVPYGGAYRENRH